MIVLIVDELAALTAWTSDREAKRRIAAALGLLLSQGRAVGVIGAVQDPRKEVLTVRDVFPTRIALRLSEAEQVNLVLGPGTRSRGALCDQISDRLPGVGYVAVDGIAEPVRVRCSHITDTHISQLQTRPTRRSWSWSTVRRWRHETRLQAGHGDDHHRHGRRPSHRPESLRPGHCCAESPIDKRC